MASERNDVTDLLKMYEGGAIHIDELGEKLRKVLKLGDKEDILEKYPSIMPLVNKILTAEDDGDSTRYMTEGDNDDQGEEDEDEEEFDEDADDKFDEEEQRIKNERQALAKVEGVGAGTINTDGISTPTLAENIDTSSVLKMSQQEVFPPENFGNVIGEIYRSSFPRLENLRFFKNQVKMKSVLVLLPEEYPAELKQYLDTNDIRLFQCPMQGNKEPFIHIPDAVLTQALTIVLNPENHPIVIHCNKGKHRTGSLVGCIRKLQNWSLTMIFDEYRKFAFPKARALDQQFIEMFDTRRIKEISKEKGWLPIVW